jgi:thioesterase CepJ
MAPGHGCAGLTVTATHSDEVGHRLACERVGVGEPVLFLGNVAEPAAPMRALAAALNPAGYQLLLVDHLDTADTTIEDLAARLGGLLDTLDINPWVWGCSQGAFVAQELCLLRPGRIRGAVLLATRGRGTRFFEQYVLATGDVAAGDTSERVAAVLHLLAMLPPALLADDDQVGLTEQGVRRTRQDLDAERHRRSVRASAAYGDRLAELTGVRVPCLVLSFEHDVVCPPGSGARSPRPSRTAPTRSCPAPATAAW